MRASTSRIVEPPAVTFPGRSLEEIVGERGAVDVDEPLGDRVREQLVTRRHGGDDLGHDASEPDRLAAQVRVQRGDRTEVRRAEEDQLSHALGAVERDELRRTVEDIDGSVAQVVARHEPAHAVRDDVHAQVGIAIVAPHLVDEAVELRGVRHVVLAPVVREDVVAPLAGLHGRSRDRLRIAAEVGERLDDRAVEVDAQHVVGDVVRLEVVRQHREGIGVELERDVAVVGERDAPPVARPHLLARDAIAQLGAEKPRDHDHRRGVGRHGGHAVHAPEVGLHRLVHAARDKKRSQRGQRQPHQWLTCSRPPRPDEPARSRQGT